MRRGGFASPTAALVWEQARVSGVVSAWIALWSVLLSWLLFAMSKAELTTSMEDAYVMSQVLGGMFMAGLAVAVTLRQDHQGHLTARFERRLARLPLETGRLVNVVFWGRMVSIALAGLILWAWISWRSGQGANPLIWMGPVALAALVQALAWSHYSITGLSYGVPTAAVLAAAAALVLGMPAEMLEKVIADLVKSPSNPVVFAAAVLGGYGVAWWGAAWERRDIRHGLPTLGELRELSLAPDRAEAAPFASPFAAQVWYEWRRTGMLLPLGTVVLSLLAAVVIASAMVESAPFMQYAPLGILAGVAALTGLATMWPRSRYSYQRPVSTSLLAKAKVLVRAISLGWAALAALAISVLGQFFLARYELEWLGQAWTEGYLGVLDLIALYSGPALLALAIAWMLLWAQANAPLLAGLAVLSCGGIAALLLSDMQSLDRELLLDVWFYFTAACIVLLALRRFGKAKALGLVSRSPVSAINVTWVVLFGLTAVLGLSEYFHPATLVAAFAFAALLAAPLFELPLAIEGKRRNHKG